MFVLNKRQKYETDQGLKYIHPRKGWDWSKLNKKLIEHFFDF